MRNAMNMMPAWDESNWSFNDWWSSNRKTFDDAREEEAVF